MSDENDEDLISRREEYREVTNQFIERYAERYADGMTPASSLLLHTLLPIIRERSHADKLDKTEYEDRLSCADDILDDISFALTLHWEDAPTGSLLPPLGLYAINERPTDWSSPSPIDVESLDAATARYLKEPWMQLDHIDWYLLNGFIFNEMAHLSNDIRSGQAFGTINWAYLFADGSAEKTIYWRVGLAIAKFCLRWLALPGIAGLLYFLGYVAAAKWVLIAYGVYIAFHLVLFPWRYLRRRTIKKHYSDMENRLGQVIQIYQSVSATTLNPTRLREQITAVEKDETFFKPAVYAILDRAIQRDPAVLVGSVTESVVIIPRK